MAKKSKNPSNKSVTGRTRPVANQSSNPAMQWVYSCFYGIGGAALFFLFNHILTFNPPGSQAYVIILSLVCGGIAFLFSTKIFNQYADRITYIGLGLVLLQVIVTVALTYSWIDAEGIWLYITNSLAIPLGITWYFILKNKAVSVPNNSAFVYPVREQFQNNYLRIISVLVFLICGVLIFYRLGFYDIWEDENLVINAAIGIQKQGLAYLEDGYARVWAHSLLISGFFEVFGVSEFIGRLPSALFGLIFIPICYYVFTRWYGIGLIAVLLPLVCMMNDRFLILFRYMRMYALLIPLFVLGVYIIYRTITIENKAVFFRGKKVDRINNKMLYIAGTIFMLFLLAHLHKLAMIVLPVFFIFIALLVWYRNTKELKYFLVAALGGGLILAFLSFGLDLHSLRMFRQVTEMIMTPHPTTPEYYGFMLDNGLPVNSTMMTLIAGLGLINSRISTSVKSILTISYLMIMISLVSMVYLIANEGFDYRYIAHLVPFVVGILMFVWYQSGNLLSYQWSMLRPANTQPRATAQQPGAKEQGSKTSKYLVPILMLAFVIISALHLNEDYKRVYVKHPWAPSYTIVYKTLTDRYQYGETLIAQNVKTYYLDPVRLAGNLYKKVPKKQEYTLEQFKYDVSIAQRGWVMWEKHKVHHWREEIIIYIYEHFKVYHGRDKDNLGVELWYFHEGMIEQ